MSPEIRAHLDGTDAGPRLFHVSEDPSIGVFTPRPARADAGLDHPVVWAVDAAHLVNYLVPRDCPRVTFARAEATTCEDEARFLGPSAPRRVVAIEAAWFDRVARTALYQYELDPAGFRLQDPSAGYYVSHRPERPLRVVHVPQPLDTLRSRGVEVRVCDTLWELHDAVRDSSLEFSMIRMRNALPRG